MKELIIHLPRECQNPETIDMNLKITQTDGTGKKVEQKYELAEDDFSDGIKHSFQFCKILNDEPIEYDITLELEANGAEYEGTISGTLSKTDTRIFIENIRRVR